MRATLFTTIVLCALLAGCTASVDLGDSEQDSTQASTDPVDYQVLMESARIPGMTVAVIEDGEIVRTDLLGVANAETGEPITAHTLFEAASLSKPVFATAVLRMAERGELDLDQPLLELLPNERISHDPRAEALTPRIVLSHQTGLPNWGPPQLEFEFEPGSGFGYSGEGYVYLQQVITELTGLTLDEFVRREVFEPLGMSRSRFSWPEDEELVLAMPHDEGGGVQQKRPEHEGNAAGSLHTTAEDFARFVVSWMEGELLSLETAAAALVPSVRMRGDERGADHPPEVYERLGWGLGWGLQFDEAEDGGSIAWHWGDNGPFKAFVAYRPANGSGVAYFTNSSNGMAIGPAMVADVVGDMDPTFEWCGYERYDAPGFSYRLDGAVAEGQGRYSDAVAAYRGALEARPDDEVTERRIEWLTDILEVEQRPVEVPLDAKRTYAGQYGPRTIAVEDGELTYQREGGAKYRVIALNERMFYLEGLPIFRFEIVTDESGSPIKLVGHYVNGNTDETPRN